MILNPRRFLVAALLLAAACSACTAPTIIGKWKWQSSDCPQGCVTCPNQIEFLDNGEYVGGLYFNGGKYEILGAHRIKLDTLAGLRIYEFELSADMLMLHSDSSCKYQYQRQVDSKE